MTSKLKLRWKKYLNKLQEDGKLYQVQAYSKDNPGAAWHEKESRRADKLRREVGLSKDKAFDRGFFLGQEAAHNKSRNEAIRQNMPNPGAAWHDAEASYMARLVMKNKGRDQGYFQGARDAERHAAGVSRQKGMPNPRRNPDLLVKRGDRYTWLGGFDTKDIPKAAGFRWDPLDRHWWTAYIDTAAKLAKYADPLLRVALEAHVKSKAESISASKAVSVDIELPVPTGLNYLPFQRAGIAYAIKRPSVLFGDEMGLGKTIQAIGLINASPEIKRVLIVTPASLKINWERELKKWLVRPLSIGIAKNDIPDTNIVILNYDVLSKFKAELASQQWDLLIADESHYLKSPGAIRTKLLLGEDKKIEGKYTHISGIADKAKRKAFLTGTPILNRPIELWPLVHFLAPDLFPNFMSYTKRYCNAHETRYGWDFSGSSNLEELQEKLRSVIMVRRLKKDVLKELPPKTRQVIELPINGFEKILNEEKKMSANHDLQLATLQAQVELAKAGSEEEYRIAVENLKDAARIAFTEISKERHEIALAKVPLVIEHLKETLEQVDKVIVFAHHKDVIDQIREAFPGISVKLTGDDNIDERQKAVDAFQKEPGTKLFIGSIGAAGKGITLNASSNVVFAELDWVPGNVSQAEDRAHRIGQENKVLIQHLVFDGSLDSKMAKTLVDKQDIIDKALDIDPPPATPIELPTTAYVTQKQLSTTPTLPPEEVADIHQKLKTLASMDLDHALHKNDMGFNKVDSIIGHSLAESPALSPKQALLGKKLVEKYHRQFSNPVKGLSPADAGFLRHLIIYYHIPKLAIRWDSSKAKWPDIWIKEVAGIPTISITAEWARQDTPERQKRLLHEILHINGLQHGRIGKYNYSTYPIGDTYSKHVYLKLLKGRNQYS